MEQFPEMVCRCPLVWKAWGWRGGGRGGFGCLRAVLTSPIYPMAAPESPSSILPEVKRENGTARGQTVMGCIYEQPGYLAPLPRSWPIKGTCMTSAPAWTWFLLAGLGGEMPKQVTILIYLRNLVFYSLLSFVLLTYMFMPLSPV